MQNVTGLLSHLEQCAKLKNRVNPYSYPMSNSIESFTLGHQCIQLHVEFSTGNETDYLKTELVSPNTHNTLYFRTFQLPASFYPHNK